MSSPSHVRKRGGYSGGIMEVLCRLSLFLFVVQFSAVRCFVVSGEEGEREGVHVLPGNISGEAGLLNGEESVKNVVVGDFSVTPANKSVENRNATIDLLGGLQNLNGTGQGLNHHHQWGKNGTENEICKDKHEQADKIEQILWDIFVEDDDEPSHDESRHEEDEPKSEETEDKFRDDTDDESDSESTFEEILSDSIAAHNEDEDDHKITKRSAEDEVDAARTGYGHRSHGKRPHSRYPQPHPRKKFRPSQKKGHRVTSRRHTRPKQKSKKSPNVSKYNEYMDVVLKRMNSMIKTKHMDPLMVNLFSGNNQPAKQATKKPDKKKKKKGYTGHKKRKGAKNRARMEEIPEEEEDPEGRSVSSESDSETVELEGVGDGVHGVGGVFIRRVGVAEDESEEDDVGEDDSDGERSFREIRALIVNGSMKRSSGSNATEEVKPIPSPAPATPEVSKNSTKSEEEEMRGFGNSPAPSTSSEESPRKKQKNKKPEKKTTSKPASSKPKNKGGAKKSKATRGVLKGLSSLKRYGDVDVVRQSDNVRIVRGRFSLGPVTLEIVPKGSGGKKPQKQEVEVDEEEEERGSGGSKKKKQSKGTKREEPKNTQTPKVTAIARELKGIIEIRIKKNSPTTIKRLRVFPPSSVKIKSADKKPTKQSSSVPRYNRVTPVATHRLRQIASAVVRQADVKRKSSSLEVGKKRT